MHTERFAALVAAAERGTYSQNLERLINRVESLRGGLKWCSGRLLDANDLEGADMAIEMAGDMEIRGQGNGQPPVGQEGD